MRKPAPQPDNTTVSTVGPVRAQLRGRAGGIAICAFFGLAWANWGISIGVSRALGTAVIIVAAICFLALLGGAVVVYRKAAPLPRGDVRQGRVISHRFGIILAIEFIGLLVSVRILVASGHGELIAAVVCLGVGIHFFPLRRLFNVGVYDYTGAALCVLAAATLAVATLTHQPPMWTMLPGIGAALVLYTTSAVLLARSTAMVARKPRRRAPPLDDHRCQRTTLT
jgi:hypothetical protein